MKKKIVLLLVLLLFPLIALAQDSTPQGDVPVQSQFAGRPDLPAPEFPTGLDWINVPAPLTIEALRGKIVDPRLLDVWLHQLHPHDPDAPAA